MKSQITSAKIPKTGSANAQNPNTTSQLTSRPFAPISKQTTSTPNPHQQQEQTEGLVQRKTNLLEILNLTAETKKLPEVIQGKLTNGQSGSSEFAQRIKAKGLQQSKGHQKLGISAIQRQTMLSEEMQPQQSLETNSSIKERVDFPTQPIQAKLKIGAPGDKYEQEADALASQVMSMPELESIATKPINASIQRGIFPEESVQTKQSLEFNSDRSVQPLDNIESRLNKSKGGGSPLSGSVRSFMEPRFGTNLKNVRVHTNSEAVQMSRELGAQAFTHGSDIYYGAGKSPGNDHLTAHELTHVMQQTGAVQSKYNLQKTSLVQLTKTKAKKSKPLVNPLVKDIQQKLNRIDTANPSLDIIWNEVKVDGIYGDQTEEAIVKFQAISEEFTGITLEADGQLNLLTRQAIDKASSNLKARSLLLKEIQQKLNEVNFLNVNLEVDGIYDSATRYTLETFQKISEEFTGIPLKVSGQLNKLTVEAIDKAIDKAINPEAAPLKANELILTTDPRFTNDEFLEKYQDEVSQVLQRWNIYYGLPFVQLKPILFGSVKKQAIILKWNASWGEKPIISTDHYDNLNPIEAKVSIAWLHKLAGWGKLNSSEQAILENMLGGETNPSSQAARNALINIQIDHGFLIDMPEIAQVGTLRAFINQKDYITEVIDESTDIEAGNIAAVPLKADELILTTDPSFTNDQYSCKIYENKVYQVIKDWNAFYTNPSVRLKPILFGSETKQAIILKWNASWGAKPLSTDFSSSMEPLRAKLSVALLHRIPGWSKLDSSEQTILDNMFGGETNLLSKKARDILLVNIKSGKWLRLSDTEQVEKLREFMTAKKAIPDIANEPITTTKVEYTLSKPVQRKNYQFRSKTADAESWILDFKDRIDFVIIAPKAPEPGYHNHTVQEIADGASYLPKANRSLIKTIILNPLPKSDNAYFAAIYKIPNFEAYMATNDTGVVHIYGTEDTNPLQDKNFVKKTFLHETAHIWSKQTWGNDTSKGKWLEWRKIMDVDKVFLSAYAMADIEEDFAETFAIYIGTKNSPAFDEHRQIVPNRFDMLDREYK